MHKVLIFNPKSANAKHRIPMSILQVGASIHDKFEYVFVDGNLENDPWKKIDSYLSSGEFFVFGCTVMPGPQLKQAIPFTRKIRADYPSITIVWGGYFAANQHEVVLQSNCVDFVINGPGDIAFPKLLSCIHNNSKEDILSIKNLIFLGSDGKIIKTAKDNLPNLDELPRLPYDYLNSFYPLQNYLARTFMGKKTLSYHSSFGCPFTCSFCAIVPIYEARWKGMSAENITKDIDYFNDKYQIDAIEFHDNNFFTSKSRVLEFSEKIMDKNLSYWGEGRIDTINKFSDDELKKIRKAGCKMIFLGAETGNDDILKQMDKGGTQSGQMIKDFVKRMADADIIPELSFVLGMPAKTEKQVYKQIVDDIKFIKKIKKINPNAEIIIYTYSPTPTIGSDLYQQILDAGFSFPEKLEDWITPTWENFDLRKNPLTPWLKPYMIDKIRNFETVLNGMYPTVSDFRIKGTKKSILRMLSFWRYQLNFYSKPYEIKFFHKFWKYRQPEIEGFYSE